MKLRIMSICWRQSHHMGICAIHNYNFNKIEWNSGHMLKWLCTNNGICYMMKWKISAHNKRSYHICSGGAFFVYILRKYIQIFVFSLHCTAAHALDMIFLHASGLALHLRTTPNNSAGIMASLMVNAEEGDLLLCDDDFPDNFVHMAHPDDGKITQEPVC